MSNAPASPHNRLANETSPYLLQHKDNPVAWWPWGPDALAAARQQNKPILLSIGYAACHWCHVMAHESFENAATAAVMNDLFVNIKVDREERPDIDQIYMAALHHLGEQGGWPLTMFLTPAGEPFWGGTYFPPTGRYGRPGFVDLMREVARLFRNEPAKIEQNRAALMARLAERAAPPGTVTIAGPQLDRLAEQIGTAIDPINGGLRGAPKFPQAALYELLWRAGLREAARQRRDAVNAPPAPDPSPPRESAGGGETSAEPAPAARANEGVEQATTSLDPARHPEVRSGEAAAPRRAAPSNRFFAAVDLTLDRICEGGIYDHLGGGFARYSVDERWLVPHFEKMLYDNAQLLELLALLHVHTGKALYRQRAVETVAWLIDEMRTPEGAFASSLDADSEGEEGKFYVWSLDEVRRILGPDADDFAAAYDVTPEGNFEGHTILNRLHLLQRNIGIAEQGADTDIADDARMLMLRGKLLKERAKRIRPGLDDKVLADWNGLLIAALARAAVMLQLPAWTETAAAAFRFVATQMTREDRLGHSWRAGRLLFPGVASDFAGMIRAAIALHEATGEPDYLRHALTWQAALDRHYANPDNGGCYLTADDAEGLIVRPASTSDDAVPNANAMAAENLIRLAALTGDHAWRAKADRLIAGILPAAAPNLLAHAALLNAIDLRLAGAEIVVTGRGPDADALAAAASALPYLRRTVLRAPDEAALPAAHPAHAKIAAAAEGAAAFVCVGETCSLPVKTPAALRETFAAARSG